MNINNINLDELRTLMSIDGVDCKYTDDELNVLINSKIIELEGLIGADIVPHERTKIEGWYCGDVLELDFYPVLDVVGVFVDDVPLRCDSFNLDRDLGILYFDRMVCGSVRIQYLTGVSDRDMTYVIVPLLRDMIRDTIKYGDINRMIGGYGGVASSLHEGDVSVSLANWGVDGSKGGYGYSGSVNSRIGELVERFSRTARVRWL